MSLLMICLCLLPQFALALELSVLGNLAATQYSSTSVRSDAYLEYGGGARLELPLASTFSLESGAHYLKQKFGFPSSRTYAMTSIQIPAHAKLWIGNLSLSGGLVGSYGLGDVEVAQDGVKQGLSYDEVNLNRLNASLTGELGLLLPLSDSLGLLAVAGYQQGLTNASSAPEADAKVQTFLLHLGLRFGSVPGEYLAY